MIKSYLLGIDIGTSACKVALFNKEGQVKAAANGDYRYIIPMKAGLNRILRNGGVQYAVPSVRF